MRLAYLGPEGTYSHQAALLVEATERLPFRSIRAVFDQVLRGSVESGVVPGENVLEGGVGETLDGLLSTAVRVRGEVVLPIEHCLIGRPSQRIARIYSHPQALGQCSLWLEQHEAEAERIACASTTAAAELAAGDPDGAAIGPGAHSGLQVLATGLVPGGNRTRFFVIGRDAAASSGHDRTLVAFVAPHRPGALHACLTPFAERGINLCRIESRPARSKDWTYHFVIEIEGHPDQPPIAATLSHLREVAHDVTVLGAWPETARSAD